MEQIFGAARDEESEDFQKQLLDTLCLSPTRQLNGIGGIFSPDFNSGCAYGELRCSPTTEYSSTTRSMHGTACVSSRKVQNAMSTLFEKRLFATNL